ncbi:MAG TPA: carboxypeptidase regulatory-like domain-containing protein [Bryobacteraceae bacterium]|nr:carboxypeptidase regulatory-like domain-containing protein [Bryobacteraceae bacterium]
MSAQLALSTLRGTATDATGAVLPGLEILITEVATNVMARKITTDPYGNFEAPDLLPGNYRLRAELPGFKAFEADSLVIEAGQTRRIDLVLTVGDATEKVTVTAGRAVITTETGSITAGLDVKNYKNIPLVEVYNSPNLSILPGVQGRGFNQAISGQPRNQTSIANDGVLNDRTGDQAANINFYEEVTVVAVNATADVSRVASFNQSSKRGQNSLHGGGFFRHVNSALNAREFFQPQKPPFHINEWGGEISGPVIRNKTFFYGGVFDHARTGGSFVQASVPTVKMRQGDFSQFPRTITDPFTGQPFPGNLIPANRINPLSAKVQQMYIPEPSLGGQDQLTNNLGFFFPYPDQFYRRVQGIARMDHNFNSKHSIFGRYMRNDVPFVLTRSLPAFTWTRFRSYSVGVGSYTYVHSANLVNTFRFGWNGNWLIDGDKRGRGEGFTPRKGDEVIREIGLQGVNPEGLSAMGFPRMDITGLTSLQTSAGGIREDNTDFSYEDTLTWAIGRHVFKSGYQYLKYNEFNGLVPEGTYGSFNFNGSITGVGYGDFLLGLPYSSTRLSPLTNRKRAAGEVGLFVTDTFKAGPRLTIDYGLRWDYFQSPTYEDGLQYNWDRATGNVVVPEQARPAVSRLYPANIRLVTGRVVPRSKLDNFRPRLSFAYRWTDRLVVRGGYGVFTERIQPFERSLGGGPFEISETYFNQVTNGQPLFAFPKPFPDDITAAVIPSQSVSSYPVETDNGAIHQFNLSFEREVGNLGFRLSYIGSRSRGLNYSLNINKPEASLIPFSASRRPFPQLVNASEIRSDGASNYDSLQFEMKRRVGAVVFDGHYTYSNNVANMLNLENPYNVTSQWARDSLHQRHRAVITSAIELPWGHGRRYLANAPAPVEQIVGGWSLYTVSYFATGGYFSPAFSGSDPSRTNTFGGLPDRVANGNFPRGERTVERWFDPSAFVIPPAGRYGNSGVNILQGPGIHVHHLSLAKRFQVGEQLGVTFTAGASNLFNHPHFSNPRNNISTPDTGRLFAGIADYEQEKHAARRLQMKLRIEF